MNPKFEVKFDIFPTSLPSVTWASIVHLTVGNNIGEHGDRIPGIWLNSNSFWYVTSSVSGNKDHWHKFTNVSLNSWTSFRIWQDQLPDGTYMFEYSINDDTIYSIFNNDPRSFRNVKIYASDPWHVAAKAKIRNFQVCTWEEAAYQNFLMIEIFSEVYMWDKILQGNLTYTEIWVY